MAEATDKNKRNRATNQEWAFSLSSNRTAGLSRTALMVSEDE
jgi:hypothetical protein